VEPRTLQCPRRGSCQVYRQQSAQASFAIRAVVSIRLLNVDIDGELSDGAMCRLVSPCKPPILPMTAGRLILDAFGSAACKPPRKTARKLALSGVVKRVAACPGGECVQYLSCDLREFSRPRLRSPASRRRRARRKPGRRAASIGEPIEAEHILARFEQTSPSASRGRARPARAVNQRSGLIGESERPAPNGPRRAPGLIGKLSGQLPREPTFAQYWPFPAISSMAGS